MSISGMGRSGQSQNPGTQSESHKEVAGRQLLKPTTDASLMYICKIVNWKYSHYTKQGTSSSISLWMLFADLYLRDWITERHIRLEVVQTFPGSSVTHFVGKVQGEIRQLFCKGRFVCIRGKAQPSSVLPRDMWGKSGMEFLLEQWGNSNAQDGGALGQSGVFRKWAYIHKYKST